MISAGGFQGHLVNDRTLTTGVERAKVETLVSAPPRVLRRRNKAP